VRLIELWEAVRLPRPPLILWIRREQPVRETVPEIGSPLAESREVSERSPLDLSPLVAIPVLQIGGGFVVGAVHG